MKKIVRAKDMGFCMGVERAVSMVQSLADKPTGKQVVTLGPIIHNQQVIDRFTLMGIPVENNVEEIQEGIVVVRAHGIPPVERRTLEDKGLDIVDGTCPKVIASQKIVQKYSNLGYYIVIIGDKNHGEIKGLAGFAKNFDIIESSEEVKNLSLSEKTLVICQTTIKESEFNSVCEVLLKKNGSIKIHNSICSATTNRQDAVRELAKQVEAIIVIGGMNSANTKRLLLTAEESGLPCWHISGANEITSEIAGFSVIGLTAGASTPGWVIDEVESRLRGFE